MNYDVFISFSGSDRSIAQRLAKRLSERGLTVFQDTVILAGVNMDVALRDAINSSKIVVVFLSEHTSRSRFMKHEVAHALRSGTRVVPLLVGDQATENMMWPVLADRVAVKVSDEATPEELDRVAEQITRALNENG